MKESFMWFVILAVIVTPFLPSLIKGKCPSCNKRKLDSFEPEGLEVKPGTYITYFVCQACQTRFKRDKSGPLEVVQNLVAESPQQAVQ